ncbi:MAG: head GIN domain-containing protein [Draconibacterium sp.]
MKLKIVALSLIIIATTMNACVFSPSVKGNGNVVEDNRQLSDFDAIKASRGMNVYITMSDTYKVVVKADENLLEYIETELDGDVLMIRSNANIRNAKAKAVYVSLPRLEALKSGSGSNVFSENTLEVNDIDISASAGANIKLTLEAGNVQASASAGSNIFLDGKANFIGAKASSGSNIKAGDLKCKKAEVKVSSGANIWTSAENSLTAKASSGGNICNTGNPSETNISKSSGGNVTKN